MRIHCPQLLIAAFALMLATGVLASCGEDEVRSVGETVNVDGVDVFFVERSPTTSTAPAVLFLHGGSFNAEVWIRTGILDSVAAAGSRAIAVDLPGFGLTPSTDSERGQFLGSLIEELDDGQGVVVVSPSMSGTFSLPLIASSQGQALAGYMPVAPAGIDDFMAVAPALIADLPTLIVWGADDDVIDIAGADRLGTVLINSSRLVIDNAGHSAYEDQPEMFTDALNEFVSGL